MTEVHLGRLLAASLHQAIGEELPMRLEFYEHWLHSEGMRDGSIGVAPMVAILGFLRTEGEAYERVMVKAGDLSAEWTLLSFSPARRRVITMLPRWLRVRAAVRAARDVALSVSSGTRVSARVRGTSATIEFAASLFCVVRGMHTLPLCSFYRALAVRTLELLGVPAEGHVSTCRAVGGASCTVVLDLNRSSVAEAVA
jgi:hypothetical protein